MNAATLLLILAARPAAATTYAYTGFSWDPAKDLPLAWYSGDGSDDQLDPTYAETALIDSFQRWVDEAPCAQLSVDYGGVRTGENGGQETDGLNTMYWDDPGEDVGVGILGVTFSVGDGTVVGEVDGKTLEHLYDADIVFNDEIAWGSPEEISGSCTSQYSIEGVATHEMGHLWGLDHSCEDPAKGGPADCSDPEKLDATMYWSLGACQTGHEDLETWDVNAITSLYGPFASLSSTGDLYGGTPLEVCFELDASEDTLADVTAVDWAFGDGESSTETAPCHTYTTQGQFTVNLTIEGESDSCGVWSYTQRERAYVLVCEPPHAAEGFEGLFSYEPEDGLIYQMVNQADTSVYGCIDQVQWDVFKGSEQIDSVAAWSPKLEFPEEGTYRVVLNLGGPAGEIAEELEIEVTEVKSGGCSTAPGGAAGAAGLFGVLASLGLTLSRRRR